MFQGEKMTHTIMNLATEAIKMVPPAAELVKLLGAAAKRAFPSWTDLVL